MSYSSFANVYDLLMQDVDYGTIAQFISSLLRENGIGKGFLLDNACGTGTLSLLLYDEGYDIIAADKSAEMLSSAMVKATGQGKNILFLNQGMTELDLYGTINACICTLDSINHLENIDEVKRSFERVSLFTESGGIFIFDVNTVYKHRHVLENNIFVVDTNDIYCVWQNELENNRINIKLDFYVPDGNGGTVHTNEFFSENAYELSEIEKTLNECGFSVLNIYDDYTRSPVHEKSERAVFVCKKE